MLETGTLLSDDLIRQVAHREGWQRPNQPARQSIPLLHQALDTIPAALK